MLLPAFVYGLNPGYGSSATIRVNIIASGPSFPPDPAVQGTCTDSLGTKTDYCVDSNFVREYYVSGNACVQRDYDCRNLGIGYACQSGACKSTTGSIAATVKDTNNQAVQSATVACGSYSCGTNANGQCTISNVPAGTYTCTASKNDYSSSSRSVTVTAGQTSSGDFSGNNALKQNCRLISASISPLCTQCVSGDRIQMSGSITGDCSTVNYFQIDAQDTAGTCRIQYSSGDIQGITSQTSLSSSSTTISKTWNIPTVLGKCVGKTVRATSAGLYSGGPPGVGTNVAWTNDISGSFVFKGTSLSGTVKTQDDNPISDAGVVVGGIETTTNTQGNFATGDLVAGQYDATVSKTGFQTKTVSVNIPGQSTVSMTLDAFCNNNNVCDSGETQESCSADCTTNVYTTAEETAPGEQVTFTVEFWDWRYVAGKDVKLNIVIKPENIEWNILNGCSIGGVKMSGTQWPSQTFSSNGYFKTTTTCMLPLTTTAGQHTLVVTPTVY